MKKIILSLIFSLLLVIVIIFFITGYPIVINNSQNISIERVTEDKVGDTINPLGRFNFNEGQWTAYILISRNDKKDLSKQISYWKALKTNNNILLKDLQSKWKFIKTDGDMATVESKFILLENGKQVFSTGIVLDESNQGLQSAEYGWIKAYPKNILSQYCKKFNKVYIPILILN